MLRISKTISGGQRSRRYLTAALLWCLSFYAIAPVIIQAQVAVNGNISPNKIEIDQFANVQPDPSGSILNIGRPGTSVDWQKDTLPNTDRYPTGPPFLQGGVAIGINSDPSQGTLTGAAGGTGHWYGGRIVDGIAGGELDQFLSGGKVYDPSTWMIGAGSIGSAKYDASQMYMANNRDDIFFGMERAGNNGTTAFDFEFNQAAPLLTDPRNVPTTYVPNRTVGDVLISYELQGSGGASGTVAFFYFVYDGTNFIQCSGAQCPGNLFSSISGPLDDTPSPAWGHVDSHRNWILGPIERRLFAEASVPLSALPGVNSCGGALFVQIRTRSSSSLGSDAKDTTPIFKYIFGGPVGDGLLGSDCGLNITYDGSASRNSSGGTDNLTYNWTFQRNDGTVAAPVWTTVGTRTGVSGSFPAPTPGTYRSLLVVTESSGCVAPTKTTNQRTVYNPVGGTAMLVSGCDKTFTYSATGTGGTGSYNFNWTIYKGNTVAKTFTTGPGATSSGTLDVDTFNAGANGPGIYRAVVRITDNGNSHCLIDVPAGPIDVRYATGGSATLTRSCDQTFTYSATGTGGSGSYNFDWTIYKGAGNGTVAKTFSTGPGATSSGTLDVDTFNAGANGDGNYHAVVRITDSNYPTCFFDAPTNPIDVRHPVGGTPTLTPSCDDTFTYSATGTGGSGSYNFNWTIYKGAGNGTVATTFTSGPGATSSGVLNINNFNAGANGEGSYHAVVQITDGAYPSCSTTGTSNAIDARHPLTVTASKTGAGVPAGDAADDGFTATLTGSTNVLAGDTVTTEWQYFNGTAWVPSGNLTLTYTRTLADIFLLGTVDSATTGILADSYMLKRGTLQVRLHAVRTLNGLQCPKDSDPVFVKALKAVDP
jgi:hypothetical protein